MVSVTVSKRKLFSSLGESQWTVYNADDYFAFQQESTLVHCACDIFQLLQCKILDFLSPDLWPTKQHGVDPHWLQDLGSQQGWRNQAVFKWKWCNFCALRSCTEAVVSWSWKIKHLLIAYFLDNISAKNHQSRLVYVKVIASQRLELFETWCS